MLQNDPRPDLECYLEKGKVRMDDLIPAYQTVVKTISKQVSGPWLYYLGFSILP